MDISYLYEYIDKLECFRPQLSNLLLVWKIVRGSFLFICM